MKKVTTYLPEDFRKWLDKYHNKETKVQVVVYKRHTGKKAPTHRELMDEAICYGWIDTTIKKLDKDRYIRHFSKRNKNSTWSDNTLSYGKLLIKQGRMTEHGLPFFKAGLAKPTLDHGIPKNPDMPPELEKSLAKDKKVQVAFEKLSPSVKKMHYRMILRSKRPETKLKRITEILSSLVIL